MALGFFNDSIATSSPTLWVNTDPLLTIGNGDEFSRRNALTILKNGYVGIGTNNPAARLHVRFPGGAGGGQLMVEEQGDGGDGARVTFRNDARTDKFWDLFGLTNNLSADARFNFFYNGYGDVMNLTGNGRVGIGLPSPTATLHVRSASAVATPQQHLQVTTDSYSRLRMSNTVNPLPYWDMAGLTHASTPANAQLNFFYSQNGSNGIDILSLKGNGNATLAGTLTQNSDARLKKDIEQLDNVLPLLQTLNGYQYKWKDAWREQEIQTGLLAQEVEKVMPELVKEDENGIKSVNYNGLVPYLLEAVKALKQLNETLMKRVDILEKR
jgi:hypothetical protein